MVSGEALKKLQEQIAAWPMTQRFVVQQLIRDYLRTREDLRAYKDTGLTPEKIDMDHEAAEHLRQLCQGCDLDRLEELAEADRAGRLVALPCKVGDTVYRIVRDADPHITRDEVRNIYFADDMTLCVELVGGRIILSEKFGKTVFLTREEAVKALEAMKDA